MGPRHRTLQSQYVEELREAKVPIDLWWSALQESAGSEGAGDEVLRRWPAGPCSHPRILAVVRKFFLACVRLNDELESEPPPNPDWAEPHEWVGDDEELGGQEGAEEDQPVHPVEMVFDSLMTEPTYDLALFLAPLACWPVGLDEKQNYI